MPEVRFAQALQSHVPCPPQQVDTPSDATLRQVLTAAFRAAPALCGYVLDEQGDLRPHIALFADGRSLPGTPALDAPLPPSCRRIDVIQALSGG